jgi:endonuclease III
MIDPTRITNYGLNDHELEEHAIFWLLVAGKTAKVVARQLDNILQEIDPYRPYRPFEAIRRYQLSLPRLLKSHGIGCYNGKAEGLRKLVRSDINLRTCTVDDLEEIPWIGPKTARCFVVHSREHARYACLDTHVLKYLRDRGVEAPVTTPGSSKQYKRLEDIFLRLAEDTKMTPAQFDLWIWNNYSRSGLKSQEAVAA